MTAGSLMTSVKSRFDAFVVESPFLHPSELCEVAGKLESYGSFFREDLKIGDEEYLSLLE